MLSTAHKQQPFSYSLPGSHCFLTLRVGLRVVGPRTAAASNFYSQKCFCMTSSNLCNSQQSLGGVTLASRKRVTTSNRFVVDAGSAENWITILIGLNWRKPQSHSYSKISHRWSTYYKDLNSHAYPLFKAGHVLSTFIAMQPNNYIIKCVCLPEMKKDVLYNIKLTVDGEAEVENASCGWPTGAGPKGSCKHISALCYALEEYCRIKKLRSP